MFLALREMRRAKIRFVLLILAVGLLVFLIFTQQTLQAGLIRSFVGGIRAQNAPALVFSVDGRRNLPGSVITPDVQARIEAVPEVGRAGALAVRTFSSTVEGRLQAVTLVAYTDEALGSPTELSEGTLPAEAGEVVASTTGGEHQYAVGDAIRIEPGGEQLIVVGLASDAALFATGTLYAQWETLRMATLSANPDAGDPLPGAITIAPSDGTPVEEMILAVNGAVPEADALTKSAAADNAPGVGQIRQSFQVIFLLYGLVVPFVTGLFFLIVTFQKAESLTLLRAIGAPGSKLVRSLLLQVVIVMAAGILVGTLLYLPLSSRNVGGISLSFESQAVVGWSVLLLALGLLSALLSARRVLAIDPVLATQGQGVG